MAKKETEQKQVVDSPVGWVNKHIQSYVETDGAEGHDWRGVTTLLLTTKGRKTGKLRRTALSYGRDGKNYLLVASQGGAPKHPMWYLNLEAHPEVELQVGADIIKGHARTANAQEKPRLWKIMADLFPNYNEYQKKTSREIPLVVVEPEG